MLNLLLTVVCLAQHPDRADPARASTAAPAPAPMVIRGPVELSPGAADAAAAALVGQQARQLLADRGRGLCATTAPVWLPGFCRDQLLRRWLTGLDPETTVQVVDRQRTEHDHGGLGTSYRTTLLVEEDRKQVRGHLDRLRRQIPKAAKSFALKCAGIAGYWSVLAVAIAWLDRLSRGYMTWRLRLLGLVAGSVVPGVFLLLV